MIKAALSVLLGLGLSVCAPPGGDARAVWASEWNARLDVMQSDFDHPCATRPFIAWADGFLAGCEGGAPSPPADCDARNAWVRARVEQCREWTTWQLRNFGKHERIGGNPPSMRVE